MLNRKFSASKSPTFHILNVSGHCKTTLYKHSADNNMTRTETIIAVKNVEKSSKWYQELLECKRSHGGESFEILKDENDTVILCLHKWGEHEHPTLTNSKVLAGNGLILYIRVDNLKIVWEKAQKLNAFIEARPHLNKNSGMEEFALRDLDGYYLLISL